MKPQLKKDNKLQARIMISSDKIQLLDRVSAEMKSCEWEDLLL